MQSGTIRGSIYGEGNDTLTNYGSITDGIFIRGGLADVINAGAGHFYGGIEIGEGTVSNIGPDAVIKGGVDLYLGTPGSIYNSGTIDGRVAFNGGNVMNIGASAFINGGITDLGGAASIFNSGTIDGDVYLDGGGTVINSGTIYGSTYALGFAQFDDPTGGGIQNRLVVNPGAVFVGRVNAAGENPNTLNSATLEFASGASAGTLSGIGTQFTGFGTIVIDTSAAWLLSGDSAGLAAAQTISGFTSADTLDLTDFAATSVSFINTGDLVLANATANATLDLTGNFSTGDFVIHGDGNNGTLIEEVTCFTKGTRIAADRGEIAVEDLKMGDLVRTLHAGPQPVKWIGTRTYAAPFANHAKVLPVCIKAGALAAGVPARDLYVSPGHAICIDNALIRAALLVNGVSITHLNSAESISYFHIELANHEVVLAENCPAESFAGEYFRPAFHNAAEYERLYPGDGAPEHLCLPHLNSGFQLAAIQRRLRGRAGLADCPASVAGSLRGYIDAISETLVSGWAQSTDDPELPVCLDIFAGGKRVGRVLANVFRQDVRDAGFGKGYHGFECPLPADTGGSVTIRRSIDQAMLGVANLPQARAA